MAGVQIKVQQCSGAARETDAPGVCEQAVGQQSTANPPTPAAVRNRTENVRACDLQPADAESLRRATQGIRLRGSGGSEHPVWI